VRQVLALAAALALGLTAACGGDKSDVIPTASIAPGVTLAITDHGGNREELTVELARTPAERSRGLMSREELPEDHGMLFVFPEDTTTSFWMKDTVIPLSIAFIAADGGILDIQDMEPFSTELHQPPEPYRYALEVNQGWFARRGLEKGDRVEIPDPAQTLEAE
jgi:uncharacterized membrane protein (UPF0127 family)